MPTSELRSLPDIARRGAARHAQAHALVRAAGAGGGGLTYESLWDAARSGATALTAAGLAPGDVVVLDAANGPDWVAALLAILEARCVALPLPSGMPPASPRAIAQYTRAKAVVADSGPSAAAALGLPLGLSLEPFLSHPAAARSGRGPRRDDLALLMLTSGSTGNPRAVELTHGNVLSDLESILAWKRAEPGDAVLAMLPPSHLFSLVPGVLAPLACGARVVFPGAPLPNRILDALRDDGITHTLAVPALVATLADDVRDALFAAHVVESPADGTPPAELARRLRDGPIERRVRARSLVRVRIGATLREMIVGGAAIEPGWGDLLDALGVTLIVGYGLTEAGPVVSLGAATQCPPRSAGRALTGVEVSISPEREILVRGANVMRGYFRDPERTEAALRDGWLRTGDRGHVDDAGFLFIEGRIKEAMVAATGETVHPDEIEPLYASPLFAEWCVAPLADADGNDVPTLVVRPTDPGRGDAELRREAARLRAAAPARLRFAEFAVLGDIAPSRTATGKVRRRALGAEIATRRSMKEDELISSLRALVGDVVKRDASKLGPDDDIVAALVLDSLESLRVLALAEKRFAVQFDDDEVHEIRTLRRLADAVGRRRP